MVISLSGRYCVVLNYIYIVARHTDIVQSIFQELTFIEGAGIVGKD